MSFSLPSSKYFSVKSGATSPTLGMLESSLVCAIAGATIIANSRLANRNASLVLCILEPSNGSNCPAYPAVAVWYTEKYLTMSWDTLPKTPAKQYSSVRSRLPTCKQGLRPDRRDEHCHSERHFLRRGRTQPRSHDAVPRGREVVAGELSRIWPERRQNVACAACLGNSSGGSRCHPQRKSARVAHRRHGQLAARRSHSPALYHAHRGTDCIRTE